MAAEFGIRNGKVSGYIACSTTEGAEAVRSRSGDLQEGLRELFASKKDGPEIGNIGIVQSSELDLNFFTAEEIQKETSPIQTADLYQTAKVFISVITA